MLPTRDLGKVNILSVAEAEGGINTLSGESVLSKLLCIPSQNVSALIRTNMSQLGANYLFLEYTLYRRAWCAGKHIVSGKSCLLWRKCRKLSPEYMNKVTEELIEDAMWNKQGQSKMAHL